MRKHKTRHLRKSSPNFCITCDRSPIFSLSDALEHEAQSLRPQLCTLELPISNTCSMSLGFRESHVLSQFAFPSLGS